MSLIDQYRDLILKLLPRGRAFTREADSDTYRFSEAMGTELSRVHARVRNLLYKELDPKTTSDLLEDFEFEYGLPDPCGGLSVNPAKRLDNLISRITSLGGQSADYFIDTLHDNGVDITVTYQKPFTAGDLAGSEVKSNAYYYIWFVDIPDTQIYKFKAGLSHAGQPLVTSTSPESVVCFIERLKPAHTVAVYTYN